MPPTSNTDHDHRPAEQKHRRPAGRRSLAISTTIVAVFAAAACGQDPDPDYQGVCVDKTTQERVADRECNDSTHHGFFFFPIGLRFPAVGQSLRSFPGSTTRVPDGHNGVRGGAATAGGVATRAAAKSAVSRGGFGTTSHGHSGAVGG